MFQKFRACDALFFQKTFILQPREGAAIQKNRACGAFFFWKCLFLQTVEGVAALCISIFFSACGTLFFKTYILQAIEDAAAHRK